MSDEQVCDQLFDRLCVAAKRQTPAGSVLGLKWEPPVAHETPIESTGADKSKPKIMDIVRSDILGEAVCSSHTRSFEIPKPPPMTPVNQIAMSYGEYGVRDSMSHGGSTVSTDATAVPAHKSQEAEAPPKSHPHAILNGSAVSYGSPIPAHAYVQPKSRFSVATSEDTRDSYASTANRSSQATTSHTSKHESSRSNGSSGSNVPEPAYLYALNAARAVDGGIYSVQPTGEYQRSLSMEMLKNRHAQFEKARLQPSFMFPLQGNAAAGASVGMGMSFGDGQPRVDSSTLPFSHTQRTLQLGQTLETHEEGSEECALPRELTMDLEGVLNEALDREEQEYNCAQPHASAGEPSQNPQLWKNYVLRDAEHERRVLAGIPEAVAEFQELNSDPEIARQVFGSTGTLKGFGARYINEVPAVLDGVAPDQPTVLVRSIPSEEVFSRKRERGFRAHSQLVRRQTRSKPELRLAPVPRPQLTIQIPERMHAARIPLPTPLNTGIGSAFDVSPPPKNWKKKAQTWGMRLKQKLGWKKGQAAASEDENAPLPKAPGWEDGPRPDDCDREIQVTVTVDAVPGEHQQAFVSACSTPFSPWSFQALDPRSPDTQRLLAPPSFIPVGPAPVRSRAAAAAAAAADVVEETRMFAAAEIYTRPSSPDTARSKKSGHRMRIPFLRHRRTTGTMKDSESPVVDGAEAEPLPEMRWFDRVGRGHKP